MKAVLLTLVALVVLCNAETINILTWDGKPVILQGLNDGIQAFYNANPGYPHTFVTEGIANTAELYQKVIGDLAKPYSQRSYDSYLVTLGWIADIADHAEDLTSRVANDAAFDWADIPPFFQKVSSLNDKVYAIILDGDQHLVYYRRSLLASAGFSPPQTWEEYIAIAQYFDGKDLNEDGTPDYGSCFTKTKGGIAYNMFFSMLASETQSQGTSQGVFFNNEDMTANFDTPAGRHALWNWFRTHTFGPSNEDEAYGLTEQRVDFLGGRCALTIDWGDTGAYSFNGSPYVKNDLGTIPLPGSAFTQYHGERRQCTSNICPYATNGINHAPFGANGGGHGGFIAKDAPATIRDALYDLYTFISKSATGLTIGDSGFDPYRFSHLQVAPWVSAGMNLADAGLYVGAFSASLNNPNFALDLRIPNTALYQAAVDEGLRRLADSGSDATVDSVAAYIQERFEAITNDSGRQQQFNALRVNLGLPLKNLPSVVNPCQNCPPNQCPVCPECPEVPECTKRGTNINFDFGGMIPAHY